MNKLIYTSLLLLVSAAAHTQSLERFVIAAGGASVSNTDVQLDYTFGEVAVATLSAGSILTQGFHQPGDVSVGITDFKPELLQLEAYPNPTQSILNLSFTSTAPTPFTATVLDVTGRKVGIEINEIATAQWSTAIDVSSLSAGSYYIAINNLQNQSIGVIKFQKVL